jgi:hypothetical protein
MSRRPILDGQLSESASRVRADRARLVERRFTVIALLAGATLCFEGKEVRFPPHAADVVAAVYEATGAFSAADLPASLDEPGRLVPVRRLVREGLLRRRAGQRAAP